MSRIDRLRLYIVTCAMSAAANIWAASNLVVDGKYFLSALLTCCAAICAWSVVTDTKELFNAVR